ncbi:MAG: helix-turn-helix transcriptional regulator [Prevotella sp.]|nr:helix-turn-helix transcriptional regulator [Prevotella sp.]
MELKTLGERLRLIRKHLGITQKKLAAETCLNQSTISRIENGEEVYASVMTTILNYYQKKISLDYLFSSTFDISSEQVSYYIKEDVRQLLNRHLDIVSETISTVCESSLSQIKAIKELL